MIGILALWLFFILIIPRRKLAIIIKILLDLSIVYSHIWQWRLNWTYKIECVGLDSIKVYFVLVQIWKNENAVWLFEMRVRYDVSKLVALNGFKWRVRQHLHRAIFQLKNIGVVIKYVLFRVNLTVNGLN